MLRTLVSFFLLSLIFLGISIESNAQTTTLNKDSLRAALERKKDSTMQANQARVDSIKQAVQRRVDSMRQERDRIMDSIQTLRDRRRDSLEAIKNYRNSRRYKDSVEQVRQNFKDSLSQVRLEKLDSIKTERLRYTDSLKLARETLRDSIQATIEARKDSLQKLADERKAAREKKIEESEKLSKEERKKQERDKKHQEAKEAYDNTKFLKKPWRFPRSALQNTYTRYNYYYNANLMYHEMLERVYRLQKTDFDTLIDVYRVSPTNGQKYGGSTPDEIIKKASLDIQMHDPRTKWHDDLYFLIARSYFYKNDFDNSIPYTKFIVSHFKDVDKKDKRSRKKGKRRKNADIIEKVETESGRKVRVLSICTKEAKGPMARFKHRPIHNDALMLLIRSYATEGYHTEALSLLNQVVADINFPERLHGQADQLLTQIYLQEDNYMEASKHLSQALEHVKKKNEKSRLYFLKGQIYQAYEKPDSAFYFYNKVANSSSDIDISVHSYIKKAELAYNNNWTDKSQVLERRFRKMLNQEKYREYFGQIHFNKGLMALMDNDIEEAEQEFTLSIDDNTDEYSKAKALDKLVDFYFSSGKYIQADKYLQKLNEIDAKTANFKSKAEYADYTYIIPTLASNERDWRHADSMLYLANLDKNDQVKWAKQQYRSESVDTASGFTKLKPTASSKPAVSKNNFYFANPKLMATGKAQFEKTWGKIPNEDNWAVSSMLSASGNIAQNQNPETEVAAGETTEGYEKYLSKIPQTAEQKETLNLQIQQSVYELGNISFRQLDDPDRATYYFDTLLVMYPATTYKPQILFGEYLIAEKRGDQQSARDYKSILQSQYPGSYTRLFDEYSQTAYLAAKDTATSKYAAMYTLFKQPDYPATTAYYAQNQKFFADIKEYDDKSRLLYIQAEMGQDKLEDALKDVGDLISSNPEKDVKIFAEQLEDAIRQKLGFETKNSKVDSSTQPTIQYQFNPGEPVQMLLALDSTASIQDVKIALSNFNNQFFPNVTLSVSEKILPSKQRLITVYNFSDFAAGAKYKQELLMQWDNFIKLQANSKETLVFINSKSLGYLFMPGGYEGYVKFFKSKY